MKRIRFVPLLSTVVLLSACTVVPGSHLSTNGKTTVATGTVDIDQLADIYPVTPALLSQLRKAPVVGRANPELNSQITTYEYRIGVGDILNVTVWDHPELTIPAGSYRSASEAGNWVHADGTIFYPYIGKVSVVGKTVSEVRRDIAKRLAQYIESPQVDVNVAAFRSQKVYISGEVAKPGTQPITNVPMTLLDAFNLAGGLTATADWQHVVLTRQGKEYSLSLQDLLQYGDLTHNQLMQNGDMLYVPRNDGQKVFVMGEVNKASTLTIGREGMSLTEALSSSEGLNQNAANATGIFVLRPATKEQKRAAIYQLDLSDATALVMGTEFALQPYDVVYVTTAPVTRWNRVLTQLVPSINGFNELTEGMLRIRNW
ncbi:polysaccharide export protein [Escherichia coli]|uniref:polysaccharide export protein n=1 Tax=Escherichia coli TaxID=562 RepID=UPI0006A42BBF|nr:polysaccharide export protein [Escherichia coli]EIN2923638.1 polysaccharide export protein [Escherichia coli]EJG8019394.1 polysaccharide export protein [Escherichia coli]EJI1290672.1 polysaccharide export protein [Escherichia coli]EJQ0424767.1 polysaccharide export protein [Escherichia coli]EKC3426540.1 polysaccharide export protein [Escherichia coli]